MLKVADRKSKRREQRRQRARTEAPAPAAEVNHRRDTAVTLGLGMLGSVLLWAAFPPMNLPWLAWIAPLPWLWLALQPALAGWRPYVVLWLCGTAHWLLMVEGIRLAHPALYAGWLAL